MTTIEMLKEIKAQRAALRWYAHRATFLDGLAAAYRDAELKPEDVEEVERYAWIVRMAANREAQPIGGL